MGSRTCPDCGARLDPEEKCDCRAEEEAKKTACRGLAKHTVGGSVKVFEC